MGSRPSRNTSRSIWSAFFRHSLVGKAKLLADEIQDDDLKANDGFGRIIKFFDNLYIGHIKLQEDKMMDQALYSVKELQCTHVLYSLQIQFFPGLSLANTGHMTSWSYELCWLMKGLKICQPNFSFS